MITLTFKIKIRDPFKIFVLLYYSVLLLLHYLEIGRILPLPQTGADISNHLKNAKYLIMDWGSYRAYPYIGFHILLSTLNLLPYDHDILYQIAGLLIFVNLIMILGFYTFIKKLFSSSTPAIFATLLMSAGNLTWIKLLSCINIIPYNDSYKCFNPFESLLFTSRYNVSNQFLLQFFPLTLSLTLICFLLSLVITRNEKMLAHAPNKVSVILLIIFIYLVHPLYAILLPLFLGFTIFIAYCMKGTDLLSKHFNILLFALCASGFAPTLIAYIATNAGQVYRFQTFMFSISNLILCLMIFYLLKKKHLIMTWITRLLQGMSVPFFKYLFLAMLSIWIYSLYILHFVKNFNAWKIILQPTPLWLYPILIGGGLPLIMGLLAFVKKPDLKKISLVFLVYPFLFVMVAPLIDYINFHLLGFYVEDVLMYSGVTSGRMLALANLLYLITSGAALGYAVDLYHSYKYKAIGVGILFILITPNILTSLKYWNVIYQLLLPRLSSSI